jgi:MYXO-CTERM domain-containing protein
MFRNGFKSTTLLAAAAVVGLSAGAASAGSLTLGTSGWTASWPDSADVSLTYESQDASTVYITKTASFSDFEHLPITFLQTSADALPQIAIDSEAVTNNTGHPWGGFRWIILGSSTGTLADAQFNDAATDIGGSGGFSINPFTNSAYSDNTGTGSVSQPLVLDVNGGGTVADGDVYKPGDTSGALFIHAAPNADGNYAFTLKEIPTTGSTPPPHIIPLPAAFWSGLTGLMGLGALGAMRRRKIA